jgi:hypothetical protein
MMTASLTGAVTVMTTIEEEEKAVEVMTTIKEEEKAVEVAALTTV